jgi:hypothetical protein
LIIRSGSKTISPTNTTTAGAVVSLSSVLEDRLRQPAPPGARNTRRVINVISGYHVGVSGKKGRKHHGRWGRMLEAG